MNKNQVCIIAGLILLVALTLGLILSGCAARENCAYYEPVPHGKVIYYHCRDVVAPTPRSK